MGNCVLIEFGGRNITEPNEEHEVRPDIAERLSRHWYDLAMLADFT